MFSFFRKKKQTIGIKALRSFAEKGEIIFSGPTLVLNDVTITQENAQSIIKYLGGDFTSQKEEVEEILKLLTISYDDETIISS